MDASAKMRTSSNFTFVIFAEPPHVVGTLLAFDKANMFCKSIHIGGDKNLVI